MTELVDVVLHDQSLHLNPVRLVRRIQTVNRARRGHAVVPHHRIREDENLATVRWIRECFDIPGHGRVEDDLPGNGMRRSERRSQHDRTVVKDQLQAKAPLCCMRFFFGRVLRSADSPHQRSAAPMIIGRQLGCFDVCVAPRTVLGSNSASVQSEGKGARFRIASPISFEG